jgi:hypothetical protein
MMPFPSAEEAETQLQNQMTIELKWWLNAER